MSTQDQHGYRRAATAALIGLAVQTVLAIAMTLVGMWAQGRGIQAAAWHLIGGIPVWFVLFLLYNQHRIERTEALEAERLVRQDANAAALFVEHADDLDLARRRLNKLYKWGLPITSMLLALYLFLAGLAMWLAYQGMWPDGTPLAESPLITQALGPGANSMLLFFLAGGVAFVSFIVARYVAGMTQVKEWIVLRGGASYLMGNFVIASLITIGALLDLILNTRVMLGLLTLVVPALMMLIGIEIGLTQLLSIYRPRKAGEIPRPAFDSRVLGVLTAPESLGKIVSETLNYQFGFEISRSWFYALLSRAVTKLLAAGLAMLWLSSMVVFVAPHQQAVILSSGKPVGDPVGSGLHFKRPWPIGSAEKYDVGRVQTIYVGSIKAKADPDKAILWTTEHSEGTERYLVTPPPRGQSTGDDGVKGKEKGGAPGTFLLAAEVTVQYRIKNLNEYIRHSAKPAWTLENMADSRVTEMFATHTFDKLLTADRFALATQLKDTIQRDVDSKGLGLEVTFVGITGIHPPVKGEVAKSFHAQIGALQERDSSIQDGEKAANQMLAEVAGSKEKALEIAAAITDLEGLKRKLDAAKDDAERKVAAEQLQKQEVAVEGLLEDARGKASQLIAQARAYRWSKAVTEQAQAEKFAAQLAAYRQAPDYYRARAYFGALSEALPQARKIVVNTKEMDDAGPLIHVDLKDTQTGLENILKGGS